MLSSTDLKTGEDLIIKNGKNWMRQDAYDEKSQIADLISIKNASFFFKILSQFWMKFHHNQCFLEKRLKKKVN